MNPSSRVSWMNPASTGGSLRISTTSPGPGVRRDGCPNSNQAPGSSRTASGATCATASPPCNDRPKGDRKSVVQGKRVSGSVDLGGSRIIKQKKNKQNTTQHTK